MKSVVIDFLQSPYNNQQKTEDFSENFLTATKMGKRRIKELGWRTILKGNYLTNHENDFHVKPTLTLKHQITANCDPVTNTIFIGGSISSNVRMPLIEETIHLFLSKAKFSLLAKV